MRLRPLDCWDCGFESRLWNGCLSLVSVVCCQVDVSAMISYSSRVCEYDRETSTLRRPWPIRVVES